MRCQSSIVDTLIGCRIRGEIPTAAKSLRIAGLTILGVTFSDYWKPGYEYLGFNLQWSLRDSEHNIGQTQTFSSWISSKLSR